MMKYYKIVVNENDETGVDFNAFVDVPAHMKGFIAFGKADRYTFNEEKRIVTGVMISVGTPIYRNSEEHGEHYVIFDAPTVDVIRKKFFKNKFNVNLNKMHDMNQQTDGATLIDSFIVSETDSKLPKSPEAFKAQNLQDGSWIASYLVTDDNLWNEVKSGKFNGFSVEGWFEKVEIKQQKSNMNKQKKSIWDLFKSTPNAEVFGTATSVDGGLFSWEGDLAEGTAIFVELEGEKVPAQAGELQLTLEDETVVVVAVDDNGIVTSIADVMADENQDNEDTDELRVEIADAMRKLTSDVNDRFVAIEGANAELVAENEKLKLEIESFKTSGKFGSAPKKTDAPKEKMTIAQMVSKK